VPGFAAVQAEQCIVAATRNDDRRAARHGLSNGFLHAADDLLIVAHVLRWRGLQGCHAGAQIV